MIKYELLKILEEVLGESKHTSGNNYAFKTPFTHHYKKKLEVDIEVQKDKSGRPINKWHCWVSGVSGMSLYSLFKHEKVDANQSVFNRLDSIFSSNEFKVYSKKKTQKKYKTIKLPSEFKPLYPFVYDKYQFQFREALDYLFERGIGKTDILRYNIGYCETGKYGGRIIVPSYSSNWNLNYFIARDFTGSNSLKYLNPSKVGLSIVGFENMINWKMPIVLTEGIFDAITIRRNAIPLFGKRINDELKYNIFANKVKDLYVCLDEDAFSDSVEIMLYFVNNGINVYNVDTRGGDPSELGFEEINNRIRNAKKVDKYKLLEYKLWC